MPRYFFHVSDGQEFLDESGTELDGLPQARAQAIATAGAMLRDIEATDTPASDWKMHVVDEAGKSILRLRFSATGVQGIGGQGIGGQASGDTLPTPDVVNVPDDTSGNEASLIQSFRRINDTGLQETILELTRSIAGDAQLLRQKPPPL